MRDWIKYSFDFETDTQKGNIIEWMEKKQKRKILELYLAEVRFQGIVVYAIRF